MKKFIQKTVAGVSALAMTAALSATAVPAFADEYEAVQEADFVQSYAVGDEQLVAEYLLDLGFSIDETTELMNLYQQGETNNEVVAYASNSGKRAYYNEYLLNEEHYVALITTNAESTTGRVNVYLNADTSYISSINFMTIPFTYVNYGGRLSTSGAYFDDDETVVFDDAMFSNMKAYPSSEAKVIGVANLSYTKRVKSEAELRRRINYTYTMDSSGSTIDIATYVFGDLDRDGGVDSNDWNAIATYMARLKKNPADADEALDFGFQGVTAPIDLAKISADINRDGRLDDQDVILYSKVAAGQVKL